MYRQSYDSLSHDKDLIIGNLEADLKAYQLQSGEINEVCTFVRVQHVQYMYMYLEVYVCYQ